MKEINPVDILRWPGVMAAKEQDLDAIAADILAALDGALDDFIVARETEGGSPENAYRAAA